MVEGEWGRAVDPDKVEDAMKRNPDARFLAFVHAETSTGALSDVRRLVQVAHAHGCLAIVDAVTSLGGVPLDVDGWKVDAVYSGSQKCLSCTPGLSPVSFNERAMEIVRKRRKKAQSCFLDLNLVAQYREALLEPEERHILRKRPENGSRLNAPFGAVSLRRL
jgi:alanine-glyoxylate transaminase / serine-glyoxylate transaminase / serine-pyruvate transaminase